MRIDRKKVALIQVAKARLRLADDDYRAILARCGGVTSSTELDFAGFDQVMREFKRLGFTSDAAAKLYGDRPGMATPAQVALIRSLWADFTDGQGTDLTLGTWLERKWHVSSLRFLDSVAAHKAIGALKRMVARRRAAATAA